MHFILIAAAMALAAQGNSSPPAAHAQPSCADPLYADLDFLIGDWAVQSSLPNGGSIEGKARFTRDEIGTCAIIERAEMAVPGNSHKGFSMTAFDKGSKTWRKSYVEQGGSYLYMTGAPPVAPDTTWIFETIRASDGKSYARETWERHDTDTMTYHWQVRKAPEDAWREAATIKYRRVK